MANATVEKVKSFGLRHGEKVAVSVVSLLCVVMLVLAGSRKSSDISPRQIESSTKAAEANINKPQRVEDIVNFLNAENLTVPDFSKQAAKSQAGQRPTLTFTGPPLVFPEPGAGLIREMPELITPTELYATAGRGPILVFDRDESGSIVYEAPKKEEPKKPGAKSKRKNRYADMMSYMGSAASDMNSSGMSAPGAQAKSKETEAEKKKREEAEKKRRERLFVGSLSAAEKKVAEEVEEKSQSGEQPKEITRGYRYVALAGTLDHQTLKDRYIKALKDTNAQPHYLRLDVQRRALLNKQWGEWTDIDRAANEEVLAYACESDEELAPENVRLEGLVDMLPWLQAGYYEGVHVASLVPEEKRNPTPPPAAATYGSGSEYMSVMEDMGSSGYEPNSGDSSAMYDEMSSVYEDMGSSGGSGYMAGLPGAAAGPVEANFPKSTEPTLMVRSLDYTVQPDTVYQYRTRIVVRNPNLGWETVKPGTDTTTEEFSGPWGDPTAPVLVPADVTAYVTEMSPGTVLPGSVRFQVIKWDQSNGLTIARGFDETPGQIVGGPNSVPVPKDDYDGRQSRTVDFTSRQIVLDTAGGTRSLQAVGLTGATLAEPAAAILLRSDGLLLVRDQMRDSGNIDRVNGSGLYDEIMKQADEGGKKQPTGMMGSAGMSGVMQDL